MRADDLSNDWYQDHSEQLVLILTTVLSIQREGCYTKGVVPGTYREAFSFGLSKGGNTSDPLYYRPIALLNTDYKKNHKNPGMEGAKTHCATGLQHPVWLHFRENNT